MLAVRLHKKKRPQLNKHTFLIPIMSWKTGRVQILSWIRTLNTQNKNNPNNAIRFITLVKIPDNHPIVLLEDYGQRVMYKMVYPDSKITDLDFKPLKKHSEEVKKEIMNGDPLALPEVILGEALPKSCIKWTKDINLLYKGDTKRE